MMNVFGDHIRKKREELREKDRTFSVRGVASRLGVQPSYLSKIERGEQAPPTEEKIRALAGILDKISSQGMDSLTDDEKRTLEDISRKRRGRNDGE